MLEPTAILALSRREVGAALDDAGSPANRLVLSEAQVFEARRQVMRTHLAESLERYLVELVLATREGARYGDDVERWIAFGASPRATIALDRLARARAWLHGRDYVSPEDIQAVAPDVLRHRVLLSFEAQAEGVDSERVVSELLARVAVP